MKANYNLTKRRDPSTKTMKWYAAPAGKGAMDADETAKMAVADTTLSKAEFKSVMEVASEKLIPLILSGISVTIGDLGKLRLSFGSQGVENMDDFDPQTMIKNVKFVFTPSATLKAALSQATFEQETTASKAPAADRPSPAAVAKAAREPAARSSPAVTTRRPRRKDCRDAARHVSCARATAKAQVSRPPKNHREREFAENI